MLLYGAIAASAAACIWGAEQKRQLLVYLFKPLTMLLIIWLAVGNGVSNWPFVIGLLFSLVGDIFLMLPGDRFIPGLAAFLVGHIFYIWGFWAPPGRFDVMTAFALILVGRAVYQMLLAPGMRGKGLERLQRPVAIYTVVLSVMVWRAAAFIAHPGPPSRYLVAAGGALFYFSDLVLAIDRFVEELPGKDAVVLTTYFAAQTCFAAYFALP